MENHSKVADKGDIMLMWTRDQKDSINLHGFDDRNDACRPEAADGGEHSDGKVVVRRSAVH